MTRNGWACVNVYVTQLSQVSHLRGNALVSLQAAALTVIRTLAKNRPGEKGRENNTVAWEVLRLGGGNLQGLSFTEHLLEVKN